MIKRWGLLILLFLLGCAAERPVPTPSPTPTLSSPTPTASAAQTAVPTTTATATVTNTPAPPPSATPTATITPAPTVTIAPSSTPAVSAAVPAITRQSTVPRWQNVAEYSFYSQSRQQDIFFTLYTPPGYEQSDQRYPVLYFLHGSQGSHILFWNAVSREVTAANEDAGAWISQLITSGQLPPFIIVAPKSTGSGWDSENEVMVTQELIQAIDGNWRTIASRNGRSLAGFSSGAAGAMRYPARQPNLYCNSMVLAESAVDEAATLWAENQAAVLQSGLEIALVVGELDMRAMTATTAVDQIFTELNIPHQLQIVPDVPHDFGKLYNEIGVWALQFHASCWEEYGD